MAATLYNLNANFAYRGVENDETGIIVSSVRNTYTPKNDTLEDKCGAVTGLARKIDVVRKVEVSGVINNNTGLANTNISFVADVAVAGARDWHGFTSGHPCFVEEISVEEGQNQWKAVNLSFVSYLGITS